VNLNFLKSDLALDCWNQKVAMETMVLYHYHVTPLERDDLTLVALAAYGSVVHLVYFVYWEFLFWPD
jgi:hypothetical protein